MAEEGVDEEDLSPEPEEFDEGPEEEVRLEVHLPDQGVTEQEEVDLEVAAKVQKRAHRTKGIPASLNACFSSGSHLEAKASKPPPSLN